MQPESLGLGASAKGKPAGAAAAPASAAPPATATATATAAANANTAAGAKETSNRDSARLRKGTPRPGDLVPTAAQTKALQGLGALQEHHDEPEEGHS